MNIEIERKFLLRAIPDIKWDDILVIDQFYHKNPKNYWDRYRKLESKITKKTIYQHTIKTTISKGVNEELECELVQNVFEHNVALCFSSNRPSRFISKVRHIKYVESGLKWEVDLLLDQTGLVIAEIEIPSLDYEVKLPTFITDNLIMEVTEHKQFSNRSLAKPVDKEKNKKAKKRVKQKSQLKIN